MKFLSYFAIIFTILSSSVHSQNFKEVAKEIGVDHLFTNALMMGGGVAILDYDNDGWLDLFICGGSFNDKLYHNDGTGKFIDVSKSANLLDKRITNSHSMGAISGDYNNDGFEDVFVTNYEGSRNTLYKNNGDGTFEDVSEPAGLPVNPNWDFCASFLDVNLDGYLDIYVGSISQNIQEVEEFRHQLYINQKDGTFSNKSIEYGFVESGGYLGGIACTDIDMDNDLDIVLVNGMGFAVAVNMLLVNQFPIEKYIDKSPALGMNVEMDGMGIGQVDIDEDGDFDYYTSEVGKNKFFRNDGTAKWQNIAKEYGIEHGYNGTVRSTAWAPVFLDFDNDTYNDFALTCGFIGEPNTITTDSNKIWRNLGNNKFQDVTNLNKFGDPSRARGMVSADLNNDGAEDLVIVNTDSDFQSKVRCLVYMNQKVDGNNWFKLKLEGSKVNRSAMGTRATVWAGGRRFLKEVEGGGGPTLSNNSRVLHWGMGQFSKIDSLEVVWLGGKKKVFYNLPKNLQLNLKEDSKLEQIISYNVSICKGELYDNNLYNESQKITKRKEMPLGYDSVTIINLIVKPSFSLNVNSGVCEGEIFLGKTFTKDTIIDKIYKTVLGCDSIIHYHLTINNKSLVDTTLSFCDVATINGQTYTTSRQLTISGKNFKGCDSLTKINLVINKSKIGNQIIELCAGDTYKNEVITANKILIESYKTFVGCDSIMSVELKIKPNSTIYKDTTIQKGESYNGVVYDTVKNHYTLTNVIKNGGSNGCDSLYIVRLRVQDATSIESADNFAAIKLVDIGNNSYHLTYSLNQTSNVIVSIVNSNGNTLEDFDLGKKDIGNYSFDLKTNLYSKGAYFLIFKTNESILTQKFVVVE